MVGPMKRLALLCVLGTACTYNSTGAGTGGGDASVNDDGSEGTSDPSATSDASATSTSGSVQTGDAGASSTVADDVGQDDTTTDATTSEPSTETGARPFCGDGVTDRGETCDDANGDELDGCTSECEPGPLGLLLGPIAQVDGNVGGWVDETFNEVSDCGPDEVLVGIRGVFGNYAQYYVMARVQGVCASLELANTVPTTLEFGPPIDLPTYGMVLGSDPFDMICDPGAAASGLSAAWGLYMDMIGISCRPLTLSPEQDAVEFGADEDLPLFGEIQSVEGTLECPGGTVAAGLRVLGDDYAARLHLRCRSVEVENR